MLERKDKFLPEVDIKVEHAIYSIGGGCTIRSQLKADGKKLYKISSSYSVYASENAYKNNKPLLTNRPLSVSVSSLDNINPLELLYKELDTLV